jgi:hypothetical protein
VQNQTHHGGWRWQFRRVKGRESGQAWVAVRVPRVLLPLPPASIELLQHALGHGRLASYTVVSGPKSR